MSCISLFLHFAPGSDVSMGAAPVAAAAFSGSVGGALSKVGGTSSTTVAVSPGSVASSAAGGFDALEGVAAIVFVASKFFLVVAEAVSFT